jgi:adenylate cyclase
MSFDSHRVQYTSVLLGAIFSLWIAWLEYDKSAESLGAFTRLEYMLYDWRFQLSDKYKQDINPDQPIVIIDIDEKSLEAQGRWPWDRSRVAELVDGLFEAGAIVVGFDVLFSEAQRNPVDTIMAELKSPSVDNHLLSLLAEHKDTLDGDKNLARSFTQGDVVLALLLQSQNTIQVGQLPPSIARLTPHQNARLPLLSPTGFAANLPILSESALNAGFITPWVDEDGVIRSVPLVQKIDQALYPSLALAVAMSWAFEEELRFSTAALNQQVDVMTHIEFLDKRINTDYQGKVLVPYVGGAHSFPYLSASDVLNNSLDTSMLDGAIVLVGASAIGLADLRSTPVGVQYPGVEIHANIINGLINGEVSYRPDWSQGLMVAWLLFLGFLLAVLSPWFGPLVMTLVSFSAVIISGVINVSVWNVGIHLPLASTLILIAGVYLINMLDGFLMEVGNRNRLNNMFGMYVPKIHIDRMMQTSKTYGFEGDHVELTVLFSDVRNFTSISESLSAQALKRFLNELFTPITEIIFEQKGTIDKYVGDMVMAFWGAPIEDKDHALNSVKAALLIQEKIEKLSDYFVENDLPALSMGIGINTGPMNVGDMGSVYRKAYTVLGDSVNLGARLESLTKFYGIDILVGPTTYAQTRDDIAYRFIDRIRVKGKTEPVNCYQPLCLSSQIDLEMKQQQQLWQRTITAYQKQYWPEARALLLKMLTQSPHNRLYLMYLQRIDQLQYVQSDNWDGVYDHQQK